MTAQHPKLKRRTFVAAAMVAAALPGVSLAQSNTYPSDTVTFVCAFPAGSGADVLVRYFSEKVAAVAKQTVIVENKPGANGNIAAEYVARAKPDGYTVYVHSGTSTAANMSLFKKPPIDVTKALRGVQFINKQPFMIVVAADSPIKDVNELTQHLKAKGGDATYGSTATSGKVLAEVYKQLAGVEATEVSYKTGPDSLNDIVSGQLDFAALDPVFALSQHREGRVRILAVGSPQRMKSTPDIPALKEYGLNVDQLGWWGVFVPAQTPDDIVMKLNALFRQVLDKPETEAFLNKFGGDVYTGTPKEVDELLAKTVEEWRGYVATAKIPQN
ncbi:tripartite-type tricarboxylate transporter receptor subunit TctC [Rhizobium petrolearium]|uniref:Bug family tripartite tricarboxylate transporter substrate binding protein n=1 Tax=Neorhizobium petrolearium TaxID=515361 RepID=UPI001F15D27A|nr:tripartite tricarboxylate transporter substrate binding protein [Neorhizobium petrolearium]MBP1845798.1 tripartite-type tricarboxylate transporter receptor subunit TctC [Neorhizobium petrolearium]